MARIYAAKGRPADHPLIVHVLDAVAAERYAASMPPVARRLMSRCWPGPLTLIVPRADGVAAAAAAGLPSVGLRSPAHPVARALLAAAAERGVTGLAAPSANRFGRISPTRAQHVLSEFGGAVPVLDGGDCPIGIESSIVDCSRGRAVLLRPGVLTPAELEAAAGERLWPADAEAPRAPGTLEAHYAPRAGLEVMTADRLAEALADPARPRQALAVYWRTVPAPAGVRQAAMPGSALAAARDLYAALRDLDASGVERIWVEAPPDGDEWDGVRDRLRRAAAA